ncbi:MAG: diacylglycerol/lipid kinase family protein [Phycisphaerales bacterium]
MTRNTVVGGRKALVIWNPNAGRTDESDAWLRALTDRPNTTICQPENEDAGRACAQRAIDEGFDLLVAAGGDGTINSTLNAIVGAGSPIALTALPLGTANDWCHSLAMPTDIEEAVKTLDSGPTRRFDIVETKGPRGSRWYANIATGGNGRRVTESLTDETKKRWGAMCYVRGVIELLDDLDSYDVRLSFDNGPQESFHIWNMFIANGRTTGGHVEVAPRADLEDGLFDVVVIENGSLLDMAELATRLALSDYTKSDHVVYRQARHVKIDSTPSLGFSVDGDVLSDEPMEFVLHPQALEVVVGSSYERNLEGDGASGGSSTAEFVGA